jgi:hypothetical protein
MMTSMRQRSQRKRRTESRIVGQATTDEPIDRARSPVLSLNARSYSQRRGTVSVRLLRLRRCRVLFSPVALGALHRQPKQPSPL